MTDVASGAILLERPIESRGAALAFSPDGNELAAAFGNKILRLKVPSGDVLASAPEFAGDVRYLAYSPDGSRVVVAGASPFFMPVFGKPNPPQKPTLVIWSTRDQRALHQLKLDDLLTARFAPDGRTLLVSDSKGNGKVIDAASGAVQREVDDLRDATVSSYFPSGVICTYGPKGMSRIIGGKQELVPAQIDARLSAVRVSADGKLFWGVRLWRRGGRTITSSTWWPRSSL